MNNNGILVVISGFSGAGKGTLVKKLLENYDNYALSISMTTRNPREGEENGVHYFFTDHDTFEKKINENGLLEYPQYTEPYDYNGKMIPKILYSGNHQAIEKWRKKKSLELTKLYRPDLFDEYSKSLTKTEKKLLDELENNETGNWEIDAINKGHKFTKK